MAAHLTHLWRFFLEPGTGFHQKKFHKRLTHRFASLIRNATDEMLIPFLPLLQRKYKKCEKNKKNLWTIPTPTAKPLIKARFGAYVVATVYLVQEDGCKDHGLLLGMGLPSEDSLLMDVQKMRATRPF